VPERLLLNLDCLEQSDKLDFGEEPDVGGWLDPGELDLLAGVSPTPALALGEGKDLREQLEGIEAGLRRQFFALHHPIQLFDVAPREALKVNFLNAPLQVGSKDRPVGGERCGPAADRLQVAHQVLGCFVDRNGRLRGRGLFGGQTHTSQLCLGFCFGESGCVAAPSLGPDATLHAFPADVPAPVPEPFYRPELVQNGPKLHRRKVATRWPPETRKPLISRGFRCG
jgi:hypothetical protein